MYAGETQLRLAGYTRPTIAAGLGVTVVYQASSATERAYRTSGIVSSDERAKTLKLWVRRKRGNRKVECSGCGGKFAEIYDVSELSVRDLPWSEFRVMVFIEVYRVRCPECGVKAGEGAAAAEQGAVLQAVRGGRRLACESAPVLRVARQFGLAESTVRAIDLRYLERWEAARRRPILRQMGVDEIHLGEKQKFLTVVCSLETGELLWFGRERKKEALDEYYRTPS